MDLEVRGGAAFIDPFREHYRELLNDPGQTMLLPFYQCQRALVRGKVYALRGQAWLTEAARYFRYAAGLTWRVHRSFVAVICGLTGSGKSTLARQMGERLGAPVINSDVVRKRLAGVTGRQVRAFDQVSIHSHDRQNLCAVGSASSQQSGPARAQFWTRHLPAEKSAPGLLPWQPNTIARQFSSTVSRLRISPPNV